LGIEPLTGMFYLLQNRDRDPRSGPKQLTGNDYFSLGSSTRLVI
jgi:hypothetical protein